MHFFSAVWFQWLWVQPACGCHSHPVGNYTRRHCVLVLQREDQDRFEKVWFHVLILVSGSLIKYIRLLCTAYSKRKVKLWNKDTFKYQLNVQILGT